MSGVDISVVVCTFNRAESLRGTLASLSSCDRPRRPWELLIVDNNSTDSTPEIAEFFSGELPVRYIFEGTQGLSVARNKAVRECRGDSLIFTDDDVILGTRWLLGYESALSRELDSGWFGGRVLPRWETNRPRWLQDGSLSLIAGLLVQYDLGPDDREYRPGDPLPFGASFAVRRSTIDSVGEFRTDLGVCGYVPGRGEEAEYLERARAMGINGYYVAAGSAWHVQDPTRFGWRYLYHYGVQKGITEASLRGVSLSPGRARREEVKYALRSFWQMAKGRGDRARQCVINMGIQRGLRTSRRPGNG